MEHSNKSEMQQQQRKFVYAVPKSEDEKRAERETREIEELKKELKEMQDAYEQQYQSNMKMIQKARDALTQVIAVKKENDTLKKTTYTAPEQQELLNIIKQLRDYIANSDIAPEDSDRLYQEHLALADSVLSGEDTDDEEEDDDEECSSGFCFGCEKPFYEILQKTGTLNCSCESPCTRYSDGKISDAFIAWTNFKTLGN